MKKIGKLGIGLIVIGVICVGYATFLLVQYQQQERHASSYSQSTVELLLPEMDDIDISYQPMFEADQIPTMMIGDEEYIGILEIPSLELTLPVQTEWSYQKLNDTPCVYQMQPFSIAAHNFQAHFGQLEELSVGDEAWLDTADGTRFCYKVSQVSVIEETNIQALQDEQYDLTLFTCNSQNDRQRIVIRLQHNVS